MKVNLKQPKYLFPMVILIPILFIGYNIIGMFSEPIGGEDEKTIEVAEVNTDMPKPNMDGRTLKTKYQNMLEDYGKEIDYAAVQNLTEETENEPQNTTIYTENELRVLDSMNVERGILEDQLRNLRDQTDRHVTSTYAVENGTTENANEEYLRQLQLYQKMARGEEILTPKQEAERESEKRKKEEEQAERLRQEELNKPKIVEKVVEASSSMFNTIQNQENESRLIKAMIDQKIDVIDGSRLRIKLMDDITIENKTVPKGTYLYAIVSGFNAQRVNATISNITWNDQRIKIALNIYDTDGIKGIYVPNSSFRDFTKEAGANAMQQQMMMNSSGEQDIESMAFQTLQGLYQSATTALSKKIKTNSATIKYNTVVYLINEE